MPLSGEELKKKISEILKDADLETTSAKKVRLQLEEDFKTDLSERKEEIGKLIQEVMDEQADEEDGGKSDDNEEDEESEEEFKPAKNGKATPKKNATPVKKCKQNPEI